MKKHILTSVLMTIVTTFILGIAYPLAVTAAAQLLFKDKANGQLIHKDGKLVGSRLIGQPFSSDAYFHSRPSAAGAVGYDAAASGGSNLGPTNKKLVDRVAASESGLPIDLVTTSASGLDPHISIAAAEIQIPRIATARQMSLEHVAALLRQHTAKRDWRVFGEERVNVLELNLSLDEQTNHRH
jgi:potassium-transporting ATPase KdpC subunit